MAAVDWGGHAAGAAGEENEKPGSENPFHLFTSIQVGTNSLFGVIRDPSSVMKSRMTDDG
jgi:hypothetical protein